MLSKIAKAITAALGTAYALYQLARGVDSPAAAGITMDEWVGIAVTGAIIGFGVWLVPNETNPTTLPPTS